MVDVISKRCICGKYPCYNMKGLPALFCRSCKSVDMVNVKHSICIGVDETKICPFNLSGKHQHKNRCSRCFQQKFPIEAAKRKMAYRSKEMQVKVFLANTFSDFIHDKPLWTDHCDCTLRRRIDFRKTIGNTMLALECDEFQHKTYEETDQLVRINDLYMGFSGKFIYIRFNPDSYKNHNGTKKNPKLKDRFPRLKQEVDKQGGLSNPNCVYNSFS